jgi:hypothetical protein
MAQSRRPSLDEQLAEAKVVHSSRLEQLIRDNQDFQLLDAAEQHDDRTGLPLWLRVYWRKNHPETEYSVDDPTGGYPRALKNLYTWMMHNQDLPFETPTPDSEPKSSPAGGKGKGRRPRQGGRP